LFFPYAEFCFLGTFSELPACWIVWTVAFDFIPLVLFARRLGPDSRPPAFGDLYLDFGSRSVRLKMFLLSLIVFSISPFTASSEVAYVD
jgi:hypothetical protein